MTTVYISLTSGTSWDVPADFDDANNTVYCLGPGGGGAASGHANNGDGGGGGEIAYSTNLTLLASTPISYAIGAGGALGLANSGAGSDGGTTTFNGSAIIANGGLKGSQRTGGTGGTGDTTHNGGLGGNCGPTDGVVGGGGGAAGKTSSGFQGGGGAPGGGGGPGTGTALNATTGDTNAKGGDGQTDDHGMDGHAYGGGGSGGENDGGTQKNGANGYQGLIVIEYVSTTPDPDVIPGSGLVANPTLLTPGIRRLISCCPHLAGKINDNALRQA